MTERKDRLQIAFEFLRNQGKVHTQKDVARIMQTTEPNISAFLKGSESVLTDIFLIHICVLIVFNSDAIYIHNKPTKKNERNAITVPWPLLGRLRMYWGEILYIGRGLFILSPIYLGYIVEITSSCRIVA